MPPQGGATLSINTKRPVLAWLLILTPPRALLNGQEIRLKWGDNQVPVAPGQYHLNVYVPYLWQIGKADLPVQVGPGQTAQVYYAAPWFTMQSGAMGYQPVEAPGKVAGIILAIVPLVLVLLICLCGFGSALSGGGSS
jgi:hypothetical protein